MSQWHIAAINRFACTGQFLWKSLFCHCKKLHKFSLNLMLLATCCGDKDYYKNSPVHTKWFVAAMCHCIMFLQLVTQPVHKPEWSIATAGCCNFSPGLLWPLKTCKEYDLMFSISQNEHEIRIFCNPTVQYLQTAFSVTPALFSATLLPCALIPTK